MKFRLIILILLSISFDTTCIADDVNQIGRYLTITNKARPEQISLMSQTIQVRFPQDVQTIESAIKYLLRFSGYSLVMTKKMSTASQIILGKQLPVVDRELGPIPLKDALTVLIGPGFNLSYDPINREVNFKLKPEYQKFIK